MLQWMWHETVFFIYVTVIIYAFNYVASPQLRLPQAGDQHLLSAGTVVPPAAQEQVVVDLAGYFCRRFVANTDTPTARKT